MVAVFMSIFLEKLNGFGMDGFRFRVHKRHEHKLFCGSLVNHCSGVDAWNQKCRTAWGLVDIGYPFSNESLHLTLGGLSLLR